MLAKRVVYLLRRHFASIGFHCDADADYAVAAATTRQFGDYFRATLLRCTLRRHTLSYLRAMFIHCSIDITFSLFTLLHMADY